MESGQIRCNFYLSVEDSMQVCSFIYFYYFFVPSNSTVRFWSHFWNGYFLAKWRPFMSCQPPSWRDSYLTMSWSSAFPPVVPLPHTSHLLFFPPPQLLYCHFFLFHFLHSCIFCPILFSFYYSYRHVVLFTTLSHSSIHYLHYFKVFLLKLSLQQCGPRIYHLTIIDRETMASNVWQWNMS